MTIDIELSLFVNLVLNSFILFLTGYFFKEKPKLWFLSSLIGAGIAIVMPGLYLPSYAKILAQVFLSFVMVSLSFDVKPLKKFVYSYITFLAMTFLFGGGCYALSSTFGTLPLVGVVAVGIVVFLSFKAVVFYRNRQNIIENFSFKVKITENGKEVEEEGFLDSGNLLYDPVTKKPVILINFDIFSKLYENIDYLNALLKKIDLSQLENAHYIKLSTVASGRQILVFSVGSLELVGQGLKKSFPHAMLGLSFSGFEKAFGKKILLHGELL